MKTLKQVINNNPDYATLIRAVIRRIGMDSVRDVINHGIDGGFNGFIYYRDTCAFYERYKKTIISMLDALANDIGDGDIVQLIGGFSCLGYYNVRNMAWIGKHAQEGKQAIIDTLYGPPRKHDDCVANALAWFAAEEVCRMFEE